MILVIGDVHGLSEMIRIAASVCIERGIREIVQLGDYNYGHSKKFDSEVLSILALNNLHMTVVPGNHEDWDKLDALHGYNHGTAWPAAKPVEVNRRLSVAHKFGIWELMGVRCAFVGGAVSIDRHGKVHGDWWWNQESWSYLETEKGLVAAENTGGVDIVFSHDSLPEHPFLHGPAEIIRDPACWNHALLMGHLCDRLKPKLWMHGHMHGFVRYGRGSTEVVSLGCHDDDSMATVDMFDLEVKSPIGIPEWHICDPRSGS